MATTHPTAVRNAIADLVTDRIDAGQSNGVLQFTTSTDIVVATLAFSDPAFGGAAAGIATANSITADDNAVGGIIAKAKAYDSNDGSTPNNQVFACSVTGTGGGGDIELNAVSANPGQQVALVNLTYAAPP